MLASLVSMLSWIQSSCFSILLQSSVVVVRQHSQTMSGAGVMSKFMTIRIDEQLTGQDKRRGRSEGFKERLGQWSMCEGVCLRLIIYL